VRALESRLVGRDMCDVCGLTTRPVLPARDAQCSVIVDKAVKVEDFDEDGDGDASGERRPCTRYGCLSELEH